MVSIFRLLELAGRIRLNEALTLNQAAAIFTAHGATDADFETPISLKRFRNNFMKKHHSDISGGSDRGPVQDVNAAYDVLKTGNYRPDQPDIETNSYTYQRQQSNVRPEWQTDLRASNNNISQNDYRNMNYFMMRMWELSNHSHERWSIMAFDGYFFRNSITVFGSKDIFPEMAKAMVIWNSKGANSYDTRAVFVQNEDSHDILLIYLDGKVLKNPIPFTHDSFNRNPSNDQSFVRKLPDMLDKISAKL